MLKTSFPLGDTSKDIFQRLPELLSEVTLGDVALCVLRKVELAPLPRNVREDGFTGGFHP
jgi:hypothetical protein